MEQRTITPDRIPVVRTAGFATATVTVANAAFYGVARAAGVPFTVADHGKVAAVPVAGIAVATVVTLVVGFVAVAVVARLLRPGLLRGLAGLGGLIALVSLLPFPAVQASLATKLCLAPMHLTVAVAYAVAVAAIARRTVPARSVTPSPFVPAIGAVPSAV